MSPSTLLKLLPLDAAAGFGVVAGAGLADCIGGTSTCCIPLRASICALILAAAAAAAAAGSAGVFDFGLSSVAGLRAERGLRLLRGSESRSLDTGERDLRSNREFFRGSGSV